MRKRTSLVGGLCLLLAVGLSVLTAPPASAGPYCGQVWGSQPDQASYAAWSPRVQGVRTGRHACFDRLVIDMGGWPGVWTIQYVGTVTTGEGAPVDVRGGARLAVVVQTPVDTSVYTPPAVGGRLADVSRYTTFRDVVWAGSTTAGATSPSVTTIGLGVRARLPFRVFTLIGPHHNSRLVIDVGHRWCAAGTTC